jgi:hypothetical protein
MALRDPVPVFDADTNVEAQLVRTLLVDAGIEAFAIDDVSYVGTCAWGTLSGINKPQVFVERDDAQRALDFLDTYEDRIRERQTVPADNPFCHHCGEPVDPGAASCAACGQSLDSSDDAEEDRSDDHAGSVPAEQDRANGVVPHGTPSENLATFRSLKKPLAWMFVLCLAGSLLFQVIAAVVDAVGTLMGWSR